MQGIDVLWIKGEIMPKKEPCQKGKPWEKRDKFLQVKCSQGFKDDLKKLSDKEGLGMSDYVIAVVNEKISP